MSKIQSILGFAAKSRQLISGSTTVEEAIKKHRVYLVICASDLAPRTIKNFELICEKYQIPFYCYGSTSFLGDWIGKPGRGVIGILSSHFASTIRTIMSSMID